MVIFKLSGMKSFNVYRLNNILCKKKLHLFEIAYLTLSDYKKRSVSFLKFVIKKNTEFNWFPGKL